jgi:hypothetical protein
MTAKTSATIAPAYAHSFSPGGMPTRAANDNATPLNDLAKLCRSAASLFYTNLDTGEPIQLNKGERFALMHSELSEAFEAERKNLMDDHLPHRRGVEVELADALIRIFDYAGDNGLDLDGAVREKMAYNDTRKDHTREARLAANGKKW